MSATRLADTWIMRHRLWKVKFLTSEKEKKLILFAIRSVVFATRAQQYAAG
jgi:hypothetical protein